MSYRFGKLPATADYRTLRFATYAANLPPPPPAVDLLGVVAGKLPSATIADLYPMDGNDRWGDCTLAAVCHLITLYRGFLGQKRIPSAAMCEKLYFKLTGGADSGLDMLTVLNYWRQHPIEVPTEKLQAFVRINPHNHDHVKQAIALALPVYIGFQVQQAADADFEAGRPWTPGPLLNAGHCVAGVGYDPNTIEVLTWGGRQLGTWAWWDECVDECYALLPSEAKHAGYAPGFDFAKLQTDLAAVAN
jgi:hypothetical protein